MFRLRFHRCDKRNDDNKGLIVQCIVQELGLECDYSHISEVFSFYYVLTKLRKNIPNHEEEKLSKTFSKVFDDDSKENIELFISHKVSRSLLTFFIVNFGISYIEKMPGVFKREVKEVIEYLASQYSIML